MRTNSLAFNEFMDAEVLDLRLVLKLNFPTPIYFASHSDIPNLPAGAITGVVNKVSSTSQTLRPEDGRAEIGSISFDLVDVGGAVTAAINAEDASGRGLRGVFVSLYRGGAGMDWANFRLEQTQRVDREVSYSKGVYKFSCSDIQREMRRDIFDKRTTKLAADFLRGASVLTVTDASAFEPCPHVASFGDQQSGNHYYLKIKYQNGYEIVRATGRTDSTFTIAERGVMGTAEVDHKLPQETGTDQGIEIEEFIYIELPAPALAYALLTGDILGTGLSIPSNWNLGIDPALVDANAFNNCGVDWFDPSNYAKGEILRFQGEGAAKQDGKRFIEREICLLLGAYMPIGADGTVGFRRQTGVISSADYVEEITPDNVTRHGSLKFDQAKITNVADIHWAFGQYGTEDAKFYRRDILIDAASVNKHGEGATRTLKFKGLHNSRHTWTTLKNRFDAIRDRFAGPSIYLDVDLLPNAGDLEVGDLVRVKLPSLQDYARTDALGRAWEFSDGTNQGWGGIRVTLTPSRSYLSVDCEAHDPYITRNLSDEEKFLGADFPFVKIRFRRTSEEPFPAGSTFYWKDEATNTHRSFDLNQRVQDANAVPVGEWIEFLIDLTGRTEWTDETISYLRFDIGSNIDVNPWSYDVDYIRVLPAADYGRFDLDRTFEVQRLTVNQLTGRITANLFGSTEQAQDAPDEAAGPSNELPNGFYPSAGTDAATVVTIDGSGFLTADGTLTGGTSTRTVFYFLGDLTIPAGRTLNIVGNVELRVRGFLQIEGTVRTSGGMAAGLPGYLGTTRGGVGWQYSALGIINQRTKAITVAGAFNELPALTLENNAGTLVGIPPDMRGTGGAPGDDVYIYPDNSQAAGGIGGPGGGSVVFVCRGAGFGVGGRLDLSGGPGSQGGTKSDPGAPPYVFHAGSGGGGAPGGAAFLLDGSQVARPILNGKVVARYGVSPTPVPGKSHPDNPVDLGVSAARVFSIPASRAPYPDYLLDETDDPVNWGDIADDGGKPENNATNGADLTSNVSGFDAIDFHNLLEGAVNVPVEEAPTTTTDAGGGPFGRPELDGGYYDERYYIP